MKHHARKLPPGFVPCAITRGIRGVYCLTLGDEIVYVGSTNRPLATRIHEHLVPDWRGAKDFDGAFFRLIPDHPLRVVESVFIDHFKPRFNRNVNGTLVSPCASDYLLESNRADIRRIYGLEPLAGSVCTNLNLHLLGFGK